MARIAIKQSVRFEVFKRDSFTCQYCGLKAPEECVLEVDHITPVAAGGGNDILNLVSCCRDCNAGKSDRMLSDSAKVVVARKQADDASERLEQMKMVAEWHKSLAEADEQAVDLLEELWMNECGGELQIGDEDRGLLFVLVKQFSFEEVAAALRQCTAKFIYQSDEGISGGRQAIAAMPKQCKINRMNRDNPEDGRLRYVLGILKNRCSYLNMRTAADLIQQLRDCGVSFDDMEWHAKRAACWSQFRDAVCSLVPKD
jgi:HNH endonuclease